MNKLIVIGGPTASGKSGLAIELAKRIDGEIINGDSMQIYKEMSIGTAKVSEEETQGVPHHLLSFVSVKDDFSVAEYQKLAREKIEDIISRGKTPIIIGGTGLYLKSVIYDYDFKEEKEVDLEEYESLTNKELYDVLLNLDKEAALNTHPNNRKRVMRALAIYKSSGETKTEQLAKQSHELVYDCLFVGLTLPREQLYEKINARVDKMMEQGLLKEAKLIIDTAPTHSTALQAIGYKEFVPYIEGLENLEKVVYKIKQNTRHYAKRQFTFFKNQFNAVWYDVSSKSIDEIINDIISRCKEEK